MSALWLNISSVSRKYFFLNGNKIANEAAALLRCHSSIGTDVTLY